MIRTVPLAVLGLAVALAASLTGEAQAQPAGSYQRSCRNVRFQGGLLSAECTGIRGETHRTAINAGQCRGEIGNANGVLACNGATGVDQGLVAQDRRNDRGDDRRGYDGQGYDRPGYDRQGYDRPGYDRPGYDGRDDGGRNGYGGLMLFDRPGYGGRSFSVDRDIDNLDDTGFNDRAWSVRVRGGAWRLCADSDYRRCRTVDRDVDDLARLGLGHSISSVQRIR